MNRILIFGNSGSGKTTMARFLAAERGLVHLELDLLAWDSPGVRRPLVASVAEIEAFVTTNDSWVIEGGYGDLIDAVVPFCTELRFLNLGIDVCLAHCRLRPWEPEKYPSPAEQDAMLDFLMAWIRDYETRTDEFSLERHRRIFDGFEGAKREYAMVGDTDRGAI